MKKKKKILLIGYSNLARRRLIRTFNKRKIKFSVASISHKKKIEGAYNQYNDYNKALKKSDADIVYISLPNSMHFKWGKKALINGYHLLVDKPITTKPGELKKLIKIANKNQLLISEAVFFNYHNQFNYIKKFCGDIKNIEQIFVNFTIPKPNKSALLSSVKLGGGTLMDMGPYAASVLRIFFNENIKKKEVIIKKNKNGLVTSFDVFFRYETKIFNGTFRFGGEYKNNIFIKLKNKTIEAERVFSPPDDTNLNLKIKSENKIKTIKIKKDNCFENYLLEIIKNINNNKLNFYQTRMISDEKLRLKTLI